MLPARGLAKKPRFERFSRSPRWAEVWQIPLFCLGLGSCALVMGLHTSQTLHGDTVLQQFHSALDAINKQQLDQAAQLFQAIQTSGGANKLKPGQLEYLKGCILLAEARKLHPLPANAPAMFEHYARARAILQNLASSQEHLPHAGLPFRLALATLGSEPLQKKNLDTLEQTLEANFADRLEGYQLIAQLRTQIEPRDDMGALRAIDALLNLTPLAGQQQQRLMKAEVLARLERWNEIPKAVAGIPEESREYSVALQWKALAAFRQNQWGEAARWWAQVAPREMSSQTLLHYGTCQRLLKNPSEAQRLWERLTREYLLTPDALQAQCNLADLALDQARWQDAVNALTSILTTNKPAQLTHTATTLDEFRGKLKQVADRLLQLRRWEDLQKLGDAAQSWPFQGMADIWLCQAWHGLAEPVPGSTSNSTASVKAYALAADYAWKAAQQATAVEKQALLLLSGQDALKARKFQQAQRALGELLTLQPEEKVKSQVLIGLAEALQEQKQYLLAADRLKEALLISGPHEASAHLRLSSILMLDVQQRGESGKHLAMAAALANRPDSGPDARTACHRWATFLYNSVIKEKSSQMLEAIHACEKALKLAANHPEAAQTRYLLAELLLADSRRESPFVQTQVDVQLMSKQAAQVWQACQHFQAALEELRRPETLISSTKGKSAIEGYARFGQAECWYALGELKPFAPADVPSADICWQRAADLYTAIATTSSHRVDSLHAYLRLSWCQQKRGLFAEMKETLRDAYQQLQDMKDNELASETRFVALKRSEWEAMLRPTDVDREQP